MPSAIVFLMYHELELSGRPLCQDEPGYLRYVLRAAAFETQVQWLNSIAWRGVSVTEALNFPDYPCIAFTFDDGSETDLTTAAPILHRYGFGATFYITAGFLGKRGYLSPRQLRELCHAGFEIGCHSMTHAYLSELQETELAREMLDAKKQLEDITGKAVEHFSCPGGRYSTRAQLVARRAGYRSLSTSRIHANSSSADRFQLGRVAVMRDASLNNFQRICRNQGLWRMRAAGLVRAGTRNVIGNSAYDTLRALLLGRHNASNAS